LLLTDRSEAEIATKRRQVDAGTEHPMDAKKELAHTVITEFHSSDQAAAARQEFERVFSGGHLPQEIPEIVVAATGDAMLLSKLLVEGALTASNSEARRLIQQGGVRVEGEVVRDIKAEMTTTSKQPVLLQVGKRRFAKVIFSRG